MYDLMIVDDSNVIRNKIERCTEDGVFNVIYKATDGRDAIEACKQHKPDIITMDLTMPKVDGLSSIKAIVKLHPFVRILVVSAMSDKATGIRALTLGATGFLCKPFSDEELFDALTEMME